MICFHGVGLFIVSDWMLKREEGMLKFKMEGDFPIKDQKKAILGSVITCGAIYTIFYFCLAGAMPWAELTNGGDCHPFITFEALQYCFGDKIAWFVLIMGIVGVVFPIGTSVLGFWYSGVRMIYAMGRQNFLPKQFSYTNKYNQPTLPYHHQVSSSIPFHAST
jgi:basic amino acid/polyamine antiporter, APA family